MYQYFLKLLVAAAGLGACGTAHSGVDISGPVQRVHIAGDGKLWFAMEKNVDRISLYCKYGWFSMALFVPKDHPQYPYYFALLTTAVSKGKNVYVANLDREGLNNGTEACDITKTGYGLVLLQGA